MKEKEVGTAVVHKKLALQGKNTSWDILKHFRENGAINPNKIVEVSVSLKKEDIEELPCGTRVRVTSKEGETFYILAKHLVSNDEDIVALGAQLAGVQAGLGSAYAETLREHRL